MVLTDLPFERSSVIHNRYTLIRRPDSAPPETCTDEETDAAKESKKYAAFLKSHERKVGPDGFVDSTRFSHAVSSKKTMSGTAKDKTPRPSVVDLAAKAEKDEKEYKKRIKVIEDHMWQHKQEERELKRVEGDIIKNQRAVRHTLRDFENAINKKRLAEDKKLNHGLEKFTKLQRDHNHRKLELNRNRIQHSQSADQTIKDQGRKVQLKKSDLSRQYKAKMDELELKRVEVMRLSQDFETKMKSKEVEQYKLKQELAELAVSLNMEAQKGRTQNFDADREKKKDISHRIQEDLTADKNLGDKLMKSDGETKMAELTKRKLSADLTVSKAHLDLKKRDEQRHLTDTQMRLEDNTSTQRQLNSAALHAEMDLKARQIDQRLEAHNVRRINQLQNSMRMKKDHEDSQQAVWEARFRKRYHEQQRKKHEDSLTFFQKMVTKGEEQEQNLYNRVRNAEYARLKQEQAVRRVQQNLSEIKRQNAFKLKQEISECHKKEKELEQQLIRETAELDKVHAQREESYIRLQKHRQHLDEDKYQYGEHAREHNRLIRIGAKTDISVADMF